MFDYIYKKILANSEDIKTVLDLGSHDGRKSKNFSDKEVTLVDVDKEVLKKAFLDLPDAKVVESDIRKFVYTESYDLILLSNVLPFITKEEMRKVVADAWNHVQSGGFLYINLFGQKDGWCGKTKHTFVNEEFARSILNEEPFIFIEEEGPGMTMAGEIKKWHIYYLVYRK